MQSMYFLIPISLTLFVFAIVAIYYAIRSRQFDDLDNEGQRIILDDRQFRRQQLQQSETSSPIQSGHQVSTTATPKLSHPVSPTDDKPSASS